tara:strand:- start:77 stop:1366 length:1290 start_codon:yes stop_codon:yes gene_type:complete
LSIIKDIKAREILDSRGTPTIEVDVLLRDYTVGRAAVPSGASTGAHEAVELRDSNSTRYNGKGIQTAVHNVNNEIKSVICGMDSLNQEKVDTVLIQTDGTSNKGRLGANAILGVSIAVAKAAAKSSELPFYRYLGGKDSNMLPLPMMNILNGGQHANNPVDIQEFMIMPVSAKTIQEACQMGSEIYQALKKALNKLGLSTAVGDEGGFAPDIKSTNQVLDLIMKAIEDTGLLPATDIYLALDCASTEYFDGNRYNLKGENLSLTSEENVEFLQKLVNSYPIISIEDGMSEDDWNGWKLLTQELGEKCQLVGDDLFVTNHERLKEGLKNDVANSILIKPNQIGTLTETLKTMELAKRNHYNCIMSHRSGETEDTTISDLAVATNCGQIKTGSMSRTERMSKYNQLIRIEEELDNEARYFGAALLKSFTLR